MTYKHLQNFVHSFQLSNVDESLKFCSEVLQIEPQNIDALMDKAEAHIANEDYEAGRL